MSITLFQGLAIALIVFVCAADWHLEGFFIFRPIIVAPLVGLALGDLKTGLAAGALVELSFAGITAVGGVIPPDPIMASVMTVVLSKITGQAVTATLALSLPFALLTQYAALLFDTVVSFLNPRAERYAREGNIRGIFTICWWSLGLVSLMYAALSFLSTFVAQDAIRVLVESMPQWLLHGFDVAGGLVPAVGFAMLLKVMLKGNFVPYLLLGFLFATFIPFDNILPVAILGVACALLAYFRKGDDTATPPTLGVGGNGEVSSDVGI